MFIKIKYQSTIVYGAKHIYEEIKLVRDHCTEDERKVVFKTIQDNAWFANPENVIVAMCGRFH